MKNYVLILLNCFLFFNCAKDYGKLIFICRLPNSLAEVSGLELSDNSNLLWMHNDSGNKSHLYAIDTTGLILNKIALNVKNKDWEDITSDEEGNLYVGDFGNNNNKRNDLSIYKVLKEDLKSKKKINVIKIDFSYPDQSSFPPPKKERFFDAESLFYNNGYLYVFSKSRVKNRYGETTLYKIRAVPGKHKAILVGTFKTCNDDNTCSITAADISPDKKKVVLLNHKSIYVFSDFKGDNFFEGSLVKYDFNHVSQKEGVIFKDNNTVFITDEKSRGKGGNLYKFNLRN
ncbi:hypothetical protein [Tenacibaculum sp. C7A-26P2]|uniref:hypothetical protein n=1 Tax=Tenacibaculum sp. C7A-26P2 TaxID=3447504 RepID=UPI003F829A93